MRDLRGAGQLEQDADVILFLVWPHKIDPNRSPREYLVFIGKNRNRAINEPVVKCEFNPSRQIVVPESNWRRTAYAPDPSEPVGTQEAWDYGDFE